MIDLISFSGGDISVYDSQTPRAANILNIQLGSLEYFPLGGIDLSYFLSQDVKFQNVNFQSYIVSVLANFGINVTSVIDTINALYSEYTINVSPEETSTGMVAR